MITLEPFATINGKLDFKPLGKTPSGMRLNVHFEGTVTSDQWEGEWPLSGIDYVTVRKDGVAELIIKATMGSGEDLVSYEAHGRQTAEGIVETFFFQTASEKFAHLNGAVGVGTGSVEGTALTIELSLVKP